VNKIKVVNSDFKKPPFTIFLIRNEKKPVKLGFILAGLEPASFGV
jgi:hypothetical protein